MSEKVKSGTKYPTGGGNRYNRAVKSSLVTLALGAVLLWPWPIQAENVGDKMPGQKGNLVREIPVANYEAVMNLYMDDDRTPNQTRVYKICDGEVEAKPYAVYDFKEKTVYVDSDRDGYIDRKDQGANIRRPVDDMPECK